MDIKIFSNNIYKIKFIEFSYIIYPKFAASKVYRF